MGRSAQLTKAGTKLVSLSNHKANRGGGSDYKFLMLIPQQDQDPFRNYLC